MKNLKQIINEKLKLNTNGVIFEKLKLADVKQNNYNYHPKTKEELQDLMKQLIEERGNEGDFNDIDTSDITDMSFLFNDLYWFNGDISCWDVSNVNDMESMFSNCCEFDCDLSKWNVSNVENMQDMFLGCTIFSGKGLDKWNVKKNKTLEGTFFHCKKLVGKTLENWDVSSVKSVASTFHWCKELNCDLSKWQLRNCLCFTKTFYKCSNFSGDTLENWENIIKLNYNIKYDKMFTGTLSTPKWFFKTNK